jgi:hypothetical protein
MVEVLLDIAVPAVLVLGAVWLPFASRRRFRRTKGAFRCRLAVQSGVVPGWRRRRRPYSVSALWVHDVLLLRGGVFSMRTDHLAARSAGDVRPEKGGSVRVQLTLDSGAIVAVEAGESDLSQLVGPFLMAELDHLTRADS